MSKQRTSKKPNTITVSAVATAATTTTNHELTTPLRRSPRLLHQKTQDPKIHDTPKPTNNHKNCTQKTCKKQIKSNERFKLCAKPTSGSRKSPRLSNGFNLVSSLRRSPRLSSQVNTNGPVVNRSGHDVGVNSSQRIVERVERGHDESYVGVEVVLGLKAEKSSDLCETSEESKIVKKRKRGEEGNNNKGSVQGWTKEQEMALQRAYFEAKPTPHFWRKVSKLVPGKSAQDCFDKIHSDHITPTQPLPRSRANRIKLSPVESFSLSASKLLNPSGLKIKRLSCNKKKSHLAQKTVRQLLQKSNRVDQNCEADLFSVLEPNMNPSTQDSQLDVIISTPKHLQEKQGFIRRCHDRSSSGHKKPLSRFSNSCKMDLVSPPVLKQVINRALHEKYIDQLHCREAKRKAAWAQAGKSMKGKENREQINVQVIDVVRAAKNALVSDARNAINQLQHLQAKSMVNSSDFDDDDDGIDSDDDEAANGL